MNKTSLIPLFLLLFYASYIQNNMRTYGMMGVAHEMAASICKKEKINPRELYKNYFPELVNLMKLGVGKKLPNVQNYNIGVSKLKP